jgi:hypothetical protein
MSSPVVLIDGPSGAGKSTLADGVVAAWPGRRTPVLVRMDDIYPGWNGLDAASDHIVHELLAPLRTTGAGRWRRHDWERAEPAEWHPVGGGGPLVIEGCGSLSRGSASLADLRVWLTADDSVRKRRALARDNGSFDAYWDLWQAEFEVFTDRESPMLLADLVLDATAESPRRGLPVRGARA